MGHNSELNSDYVHYSVFYREVLENLSQVKDFGDGIFVDCTLGEGGHSELVLKKFPEISVIGFERDPEIIQVAKKRLSSFGDRVKLINDNFSKIDTYLSGMEGQISAILYDFGISSYHFDMAKRGFTFRDEQPLDMRLDPDCQHDASYIVNNYTERDLANVIYKYGEERFSRRIARRICAARDEEKIKTTARLAEIVLKAIPGPGPKKKKSQIHPATRTFQALRIEVNGELNAIENTLKTSWRYLAPQGRIMAISFHSLEDRITKHEFRKLALGCTCENEEYCTCDRISKVKILTKKPILPSKEELNENVRSRSAKLRICERI